jgi:hypothetical protein
MSKLKPSNVIRRMRHSSVRNYGIPGLTSYLIGGNHHGMVRLFEADRTTYERITPHSHRFDFTAVVLTGRVENVTFHRAQSVAEYNHKEANPYWVSFLNVIHDESGKPIPGEYDHFEGYGPVSFFEDREEYHPGDWYSIRHNEIHCIYFEKGTSVLMFESPNVVDQTTILEPIANGKRVPTFKVEDWMFLRNKT